MLHSIVEGAPSVFTALSLWFPCERLFWVSTVRVPDVLYSIEFTEAGKRMICLVYTVCVLLQFLFSLLIFMQIKLVSLFQLILAC